MLYSCGSMAHKNIGGSRPGSTPIDKDDLSALIEGNAQLWLFTLSEPAGAAKVTTEPVR